MNKHIRLITPITTHGFRTLDGLRTLERADLQLSLAAIDSGPASIECETDDALATPGTLEQIVQAEREGVDAVVIDCMADPAVAAGRELARIPVFGPGQTSMHVAALLGHSFSVITVLPRLRYQFQNEAKLYGLADSLASVRSVDIPVLALEEDLVATKKSLADIAIAAVEEDGADAIIFGCTGMLGCAAAVREALLARGYDIPVIDPIPTTITVAAAMLDVGLAHSKLAFAFPEPKPVVGYKITLGAMPAAAE